MTKAYLEPDEVEKLEKTARSVRDVLLIRLLFRLGCRISELLAVEVKDIDFEQGTVTIQHLKQRLKLLCPNCQSRLGRSHIFCPKCGKEVAETSTRYEEYHRVRTLPIDDNTLDMLHDYIEKGGPVYKGDKTIIFNINRHRAFQIVRDCAGKAGLPGLVNPETGRLHHVSPHRLRDAFATHAIKVNDSSGGLRLLQEHLGHASFNTTARYRKVAGGEHKEWYKQLWKDDKP
jgi:integrase/recombinase XerD